MSALSDLQCPLCDSPEVLILKKDGRPLAKWNKESRPLAKLLGIKNLMLICVQCGAMFHPSEAINTTPIAVADSAGREGIHALDLIDRTILEIYTEKGKTAAITYCKNARFWTLATSKKKVEALAQAHELTEKKEGCFIATTCYGDYEAKEVRTLRIYRDTILSSSWPGRLCVSLYYFCSPPVALVLRYFPLLSRYIRLYLLDPIVARLEYKMNRVK